MNTPEVVASRKPAGEMSGEEEAATTRRLARPGGGYRFPLNVKGRYEVLSWFFMRISGLILVLLALYHLIWWNLVIGVEHLDSQVVIERWRNPLWRFFNVALITFAMLHGLNGARYSIEDYVRRPGLQLLVKVLVYTIVLVILGIGLFALVTFDPAAFFADR